MPNINSKVSNLNHRQAIIFQEILETIRRLETRVHLIYSPRLEGQPEISESEWNSLRNIGSIVGEVAASITIREPCPTYPAGLLNLQSQTRERLNELLELILTLLQSYNCVL